MVVLHVAAAYQFYTQPVFQLIDYRIKKTTGHPQVNPYLQTAIRLFYVVCVTVVGIVIPFFGSLMVSSRFAVTGLVLLQAQNKQSCVPQLLFVCSTDCYVVVAAHNSLFLCC